MGVSNILNLWRCGRLPTPGFPDPEDSRKDKGDFRSSLIMMGAAQALSALTVFQVRFDSRSLPTHCAELWPRTEKVCHLLLGAPCAAHGTLIRPAGCRGAKNSRNHAEEGQPSPLLIGDLSCSERDSALQAILRLLCILFHEVITHSTNRSWAVTCFLCHVPFFLDRSFTTFRFSQIDIPVAHHSFPCTIPVLCLPTPEHPH